MEKSNKKAPIVFYIGIILLCIWLTSIYLIGGLYAKYSTYASGSDSARVAKFDVSASDKEGQSSELSLDLKYAEEAREDSYTFTVKSNSEVAVSYTVKVTLPSALPNGVSMTMTMTDGETTEMIPTESDNVYTYNATLDFTDSHEWILTFTGDPDVVTEDVTLANITIKVDAEQID